MKEKVIIDTTTDRISQLPESILHHILSFSLSQADLVRSSVLSKQWLALTASFPILDFNFNRFIRYSQPIKFPSRTPTETRKRNTDLRKKFWKYISYTTSRFCKESVSAHTFKLVTYDMEVNVIHKCFELIIKKGVAVMHIEINDCNLLSYRLPNILLCASSLTSLTIRNCELPSSLMTHAGNFKSLKKLDLGLIRIDDEMIKYFTTNCCLLEEFSLQNCYGFKRVCIYGLQNLHKVRIDYSHEVERIDIEAPNLCHLFLVDTGSSMVAPSMNLTLCKKLTTLSFCGYSSLNMNLFTDLFTNFPFIENLVLSTPEDCNNLKFSSNSLRTLVVHSDPLDEIQIDTPNLVLFEYVYSKCLSEPHVRNSVESQVCMECYPNYGVVDSLWFQKLGRFLEKNNRFKVLKLHIHTILIDVEELKVIESPNYELERVELNLKRIKELSVYVTVLEAVLWCCRPKSLTLISEFSSINFEERNHVIKCTYEKLLEQEDQSQTNIQIVSSFSSNRFSDLDSLLAALPCHPKRQILQNPLTITFIKEQ